MHPHFSEIISFVEGISRPDVGKLHKKISEVLPEYARPCLIKCLRELPRNVNDKIDVCVLREMLANE